ncbi:MAG: hypothetical protein ABSB65_12160 [Candidatus Acidiferrales bacterium]|jgi:hypothetical protein
MSNADRERPVIEINVSFARLYEQIEQLRHLAPTVTIDLSGTRFDPANPADAEQAISIWNSQIDLQFRPYRDNPFIGCLIVEIKKVLSDWVSSRIAEAQRKLLENPL